MLPILLNAPYLKIYTYGVFLVLSFLWGAFWYWKLVRLTAHREEDMFDIFFLVLSGGLIGSRIVYILVNFNDFGFDILRWILVNGYPGGSLIGFLLGGFGVLYWICTTRKLSFRMLSDYFASPLLLALCISKLGAFLSGSDVGTKTTFFLATRYIGHEGLRHITGLYEALIYLITFYIAYKIIRAVRRNTFPNGFSFLFLLYSISITYVLLDTIKENHLYLGGISFNLGLSVPVCIALSIWYLYYWRVAIHTHIINTLNVTKHHVHTTYNRIPRRTKDKSLEEEAITTE